MLVFTRVYVCVKAEITLVSLTPFPSTKVDWSSYTSSLFCSLSFLHYHHHKHHQVASSVSSSNTIIYILDGIAELARRRVWGSFWFPHFDPISYFMLYNNYTLNVYHILYWSLFILFFKRKSAAIVCIFPSAIMLVALGRSLSSKGHYERIAANRLLDVSWYFDPQFIFIVDPIFIFKSLQWPDGDVSDRTDDSSHPG